MDENNIHSGADWMAAIGNAIEESTFMVCVLDSKFPTSTYCCNELVMAQSCGLKLFPLIFRGQTFQQLPAGLRCALFASCIQLHPAASFRPAPRSPLPTMPPRHALPTANFLPQVRAVHHQLLLLQEQRDRRRQHADVAGPHGC